MSKCINVKYEGKPLYNIVIEQSFDKLAEEFDKLGVTGRKLCIVSDSNVAPLYAKHIEEQLLKTGNKVFTFVFEAGEANKNLDTVEDVYEFLIKNHFDRKDMLVALGGGVVGDLTGFTAATYLRGISFIQVPTSLLAQVDSSIGGKTGVDFRAYKNMVGAFYQPKLVYMNISVLKSLSDRLFNSGFGEIIKHGLIKDAAYYEWLRDNISNIKSRNSDALEQMIYVSCNIKREVVEKDPKEKGDRALLNYGHTLGHAIEKLMDFKLYHGECVTLGLGRVKLENTTNDDNGYTNNGDSGAHGSANLDLLALTWKQMDTSVTLGRQNLNIGQGLIWWDNPVDGIMVTQDLGNNSLISAGWGNLTAENWKDYSMNAFIANAQIGVDDNTKFTLGYLKTNSNENTLYNNHKNQWNWIESSENPYMLEQIAYGINTQLSDKWNLTAEAVTNRASGLPDGAQKNGWWTRLTYGNLKWDTKDTWKVYADYMSLGNYSVDSTGWAHILNTPGGDGLGGNGEKGYGLGISYMLADNTNLEFNWYKLRPYDSNYSGFSDYYDMYNLALNYSF